MNTNLLNFLKEEKYMRYKGGLYHYSQIKFTYNTNRIEGNKLSEEQTRFIYETNSLSFENEKIISVDDIMETVNHFKCFDYMLDTANNPLSEDIIKEYHKLLKYGTSDSKKEWFNIGDYKSRSNIVGEVKTTSPSKVNAAMNNLISSYLKHNNTDIDSIIDFHYKFEKIHPFQDGNGRVGRLIIFKECLKNQIVPVMFEDEYKRFYYKGLNEYKKTKGYLRDTFLFAQDRYKDILKYFEIIKDNYSANDKDK